MNQQQQDLADELDRHPYDIEKHRQLVYDLIACNQLDEASHAIERMCRTITPDSMDGVSWVNSLLGHAQAAKRASDAITADNKTVAVAKVVPKTNEGDYQAFFEKFKHHMTVDASALFNDYLQISADPTRLYLDRLATPSLDLEAAFQLYSEFVTENYGEEYEQRMVEANKVMAPARKLVEQRATWEARLAQDPSLQTFAEYIQWERKKPGKKQDKQFIKALYERCVECFPRVPEVWDDYILWASSVSMQPEFSRAVKHCPFSGLLWHHLVLDEQTHEAIQHAKQCSLLYDNGGWQQVSKAACVVHTKQNNAEKLVQEFGNINQLAGGEGMGEELLYTLLACLSQLASDKAVELCELYKPQRQNERIFWSKYVDVMRKHDVTRVVDVFEEAMMHTNTMDWPDDLIRDYVEHCLITGSGSKKYFQAIAKSNRKLKQLHEKRSVVVVEPHVAKRAAEDETEAPLAPHKRQKSAAAPTSRDREHCEVVVTNLPSTASQQDIQRFFEDCGDIVQVVVSESAATVEFSDKQGALSGLTRDGKALKGSNVTVRSGDSTTLWVTNFPPSYTPETVKALFEAYGKVIDVRFPSQRQKARRFCYVQFQNDIEAHLALSRLNSKELEGHKLVVKVSDPEKRGERTDSAELIVKSIDFKVSEQEVRELFGHHGTVSHIKLPNNHKNKDKLHDGYAFITLGSSDEAQACVDALNGHELNGRKISVGLVNSSKKLPHKVALDPSRVVTVYNIADVVSEDQVKGLFGEQGTVTNVQFERWKQSAKVEYEDASSTGKAALTLDGRELGGSNIQFSPPTDAKKSTMFMPRKLR